MIFQYDTVVVGAGKTGRKIASGLRAENQKVAIVSLNDDSATLFPRTILSLAKNHPTEDPNPTGPDEVDSYRGSPTFESKKRTLALAEDQLRARDFVIATGAIPALPSIQGLQETPFHYPLSILKEPNIPKSAVIIGGGPVAVNLADFLSQQKCQTILISNKPRLLRKEEPEISLLTASLLEKNKSVIHLNSHVIQTRPLRDKKVSVVFEKNGERNEVETEALIIAAGFTSNSRHFGFENLGVYIDEQSRVVVNDQLRSSVPHVWAAGSVTGPPFHLALYDHQSEIIVNNVTSPFFSQIRMEDEPIPRVISTHSPIATLGLLAEEATKKYSDTKVCVHSLKGFQNEEAGFIKLIGRKKSGEILGVHILGPHADDLILYFNLAKRADISLYDLLDRQHYPSPTISESIYHAIKRWAHT